MNKKEFNRHIDINEINRHAFNEAQHYLNIKSFGCELICPYYINKPISYITDLMRSVGVNEADVTNLYSAFKKNMAPYGWYQGKASPEEIEETIKLFLPNAGFGRPRVTSEGIRDLMRLRGLGIDCSGFVFNVLKKSFENEGLLSELYNSISWKDPNKMNVFQAGVSVLADSSFSIDQRTIRPLDLLILEKRGHIAIVLQDSDGLLKVYQSTPWTSPSGVNSSNIEIVNEKVKFSFIPSMGDSWDEMNQRNEIEFRRLNIFK